MTTLCSRGEDLKCAILLPQPYARPTATAPAYRLGPAPGQLPALLTYRLGPVPGQPSPLACRFGPPPKPRTRLATTAGLLPRPHARPIAQAPHLASSPCNCTWIFCLY
ncbi:hypothetical protein GUJ93_ZPchr0012g19828 [Zizania palustris]|uniref:Uncharacterized protein n=1 Tax=Zizania palustris TaxID=103762 RepID=A0A8J6BTC3_ZIZPA|nr:hypothetical protein GUJ93_ZPchr0012g19828 [Zizania palustris]